MITINNDHKIAVHNTFTYLTSFSFLSRQCHNNIKRHYMVNGLQQMLMEIFKVSQQINTQHHHKWPMMMVTICWQPCSLGNCWSTVDLFHPTSPPQCSTQARIRTRNCKHFLILQSLKFTTNEVVWYTASNRNQIYTAATSLDQSLQTQRYSLSNKKFPPMFNNSVNKNQPKKLTKDFFLGGGFDIKSLYIHRESKKTRHQTLGHNFTKYWPIFKIFSVADLAVNLQQIHV